MSSTDVSNFNRVTKTKRQHTAACERCRGQKLRCIRTPKGCERCQKTGAVCIVDPNVRMGRPQRGDTAKERRERQDKVTSPPESGPISQSGLSDTVDWTSETNENMWLAYDFDERKDINQARGQDIHRDQELFDVVLQNNMSDDQFASTSASVSDDWYDTGFDQAFLQPSSTSTTAYSVEPSPFISIEPPTLTKETKKRNSQSSDSSKPSSTSSQSLIERVTSLNLDLHQQSIIAGQIVDEFGNIDPDMIDPLHKDNRLSFAVDSMTQGLQNFHSLLLEIINTANGTTFSSESASPHVNRPPIQQQQSPSRFLAPPSRSCVPSLFCFREGNSSQQQSKNNATGIDLPTSLMIISCHIHLIRLCRHVFAGIRAALSSKDQHQQALLVLSSCQVGGVSISHDSDLKLLILIQVVARLINKIGVLLGYPCSPADLTNSAVGNLGNTTEDERKKMLLPQLLRFVLAQEGVAGQSSHGDGMEGLREEIRKLNEVLATS